MRPLNWLSGLRQRLHNGRRPQKRRLSRRTYSSVEALESRQLLAADIMQLGTALYVFGTQEADTVEVREEGTRLVVSTADGADVADAKDHVFSRSGVNSVVFFGRDGDDAFTNKSRVPARAYGGDGDDSLVGGSAADVLYGEAGDDVLVGSEGNDQLSGGAGNDFLLAGRGNDRIDAGSGNDQAYGEEGDDSIFGGAGNDLLAGGDGSDSLYGQSGRDQIFGGSGLFDILDGGTGNDELVGGSGWESITGGSGFDRVNYGGSDEPTYASLNEDELWTIVVAVHS